VRSLVVTVVSEPNRYCTSPSGADTGDTRQEDTCGQAAVEQDGKPNVAAGLAALAEHLDQNSARDAGDYGDRRCSAGQ